ncbi:MAG: hypothetical protein ABI882_18635, partial [Acidobacteriota bacterium]
GFGAPHSSAARTARQGETARGSLKYPALADSLREAIGTARQSAGAVVEGVPVDISQEAYLKASNTGQDDAFGWSIAVSGDTVIVGAVNEKSAATGINGDQTSNSAPFSGAAYVFVRIGGVWSQQAYLKASNTGANDAFGHSVAISGDTIVVGAPYEDSSATGINGNGANNASPDSGAAYVYVRTAGVWSQQAYLKASNTGTGDRFGYSVAASGDTVLVGADGEDSSATGVNGNATDNSAEDSGAGYAFVRNGSAWSQQAYLKASNTDQGDSFGWSVGVSGDTVVAGAPSEDSAAIGVNGDENNDSAESAGAGYVFIRSGTTWTQQAYLKAANAQANDFFGYATALSVNTIVIGAVTEDGGTTGVNGNGSDNSAEDSGAAYVFVRTANLWSQQAYLKASNTGASDFFGNSVALSGDTIVVGAPFEFSAATGVNGDGSNNSARDSGAAYEFQRTGSVWTQKAYLKASNTREGDRFGSSVGVSTAVVVGAPSEDSAATGINGNQSDISAADAGAAYILTEGGQQSRSVSVAGSTIATGSNGFVSVVFDAHGDENTVALSLTFDTTRLSFVSAVLAAGLPAGSNLVVNSSQAGSGRVGFTINLPAGQSLAAGTRQLLTMTVTALNNAPQGTTQISFGDVPVSRAVFRSDASLIPINAIVFNPGSVNLIAPIPPRNVRALGTTIQVGGSGTVGVEIDALGTENGLAFSLTFEASLLTFASASLGSGAPGASLNVNTSETGSGRIGIAFDLPAGQALQAGTLLVVNILFNAVPGVTGGTSQIGFGDSPVVRELLDTSGAALPVNFVGSAVTIGQGQDFEGDTTPRPNGNGSVSLADWVQTGRFAIGLDTAAPGGEFQRADCAPRDTRGNGLLSLSDWVQAGRYAVGLDPLMTVGGPTAPSSFTAAGPPVGVSRVAVARGLREQRSITTIVSAPARTGVANIGVWIDATGVENAISFSLSFDATQWEFAGIQPGRDAATATLIVNSSTGATGRLGVAIALPPGQAAVTGWRTVAEIHLRPRSGGRHKLPVIALVDDGPVAIEVADLFGNAVPFRWVTKVR